VRDTVRAAMGVNTWEGVEWLDRDRFANLLRWAARLDALDAERGPDEALVARLTSAAGAAGYRVDALLASLSAPTRASRPTSARSPRDRRDR
jgi:hypothetical protein